MISKIPDWIFAAVFLILLAAIILIVGATDEKKR